MRRLNPRLDVTGLRPPEAAQKWLKSTGPTG